MIKKKDKPKKPFLPTGCGGGFAGFMLGTILNGVMGDHIPLWVKVVLFLACISIGIGFQIIDDRNVESDIIIGNAGHRDRKKN